MPDKKLDSPYCEKKMYYKTEICTEITWEASLTKESMLHPSKASYLIYQANWYFTFYVRVSDILKALSSSINCNYQMIVQSSKKTGIHVGNQRTVRLLWEIKILATYKFLKTFTNNREVCMTVNLTSNIFFKLLNSWDTDTTFPRPGKQTFFKRTLKRLVIYVLNLNHTTM